MKNKVSDKVYHTREGWTAYTKGMRVMDCIDEWLKRHCHPKTTCSGNESVDTKDYWLKWIFGKWPCTVNL